MAPVLKYLDFSKTFYLYTNVSGTGLETVLSQKGENEKEYIIAYASKGLTRAEQNYATTKLEYYAIIWGVEYFHHYLGYKPFIIITDHVTLYT
ncbi:466_t:CDS:1, partial [Dentiscutata erythropus]